MQFCFVFISFKEKAQPGTECANYPESTEVQHVEKQTLWQCALSDQTDPNDRVDLHTSAKCNVKTNNQTNS